MNELNVLNKSKTNAEKYLEQSERKTKNVGL